MKQTPEQLLANARAVARETALKHHRPAAAVRTQEGALIVCNCNAGPAGESEVSLLWVDAEGGLVARSPLSADRPRVARAIQETADGWLLAGEVAVAPYIFAAEWTWVDQSGDEQCRLEGGQPGVTGAFALSVSPEGQVRSGGVDAEQAAFFDVQDEPVVSRAMNDAVRVSAMTANYAAVWRELNVLGPSNSALLAANGSVLLEFSEQIETVVDVEGAPCVAGWSADTAFVSRLSTAGERLWTRDLRAAPGALRATQLGHFGEQLVVTAERVEGYETRWLEVIGLGLDGQVRWRQEFGGAAQASAAALLPWDGGVLVVGVCEPSGLQTGVWLTHIKADGSVAWQRAHSFSGQAEQH